MITVAITRGIDPSTRGCAHCTITVSTVHCSYSETAKCSRTGPSMASDPARPPPQVHGACRRHPTCARPPPRSRAGPCHHRRPAAPPSPARLAPQATGRITAAGPATPPPSRPAGSVSLLQKPQSPRLSWARCAAVRRARGPPSSSERRDPGVVLSRGDRREDSRHARRPPLPPPRHRCPTLCAVIIFSVL